MINEMLDAASDSSTVSSISACSIVLGGDNTVELEKDQSKVNPKFTPVSLLSYNILRRQDTLNRIELLNINEISSLLFRNMKEILSEYSSVLCIHKIAQEAFIRSVETDVETAPLALDTIRETCGGFDDGKGVKYKFEFFTALSMVLKSLIILKKDREILEHIMQIDSDLNFTPYPNEYMRALYKRNKKVMRLKNELRKAKSSCIPKEISLKTKSKYMGLTKCD